VTFEQISERMTRFEEAVFQRLDAFAGVSGVGVRGLARHADPGFDAAANTSFLLDSKPHVLLSQADAARKAQVLLLCNLFSYDLFLDPVIQTYVRTCTSVLPYV